MQIKPKPIPTLKARPGSTEEIFAKTLAGAEALWRETHIESLIERTMSLLQKNFAISSLTLVKISEDKQIKLLPSFDKLNIFSSDKLKAILSQLGSIQEKHSEYNEGINSIVFEGKNFNFAVLSESEVESHILFWLETETLSENTEVAIDFLVRQLQTTFRWFSRMSETQTLLHLDDLTGLYNHRYLDVALDREIKRSQRYGSHFSLLFIDLDRFKPINDTYGHLAGSQVLREVAAIIKATVRDVDLVFRYGGDEFVVIPIEADSKTGYRSAKRIQERIEATKFVVAKDAIAQVTSSIGIASFPEHADAKDRLIALADECMYESKRRGKNQVVLANPVQLVNTLSQKDAKAWPTR